MANLAFKKGELIAVLVVFVIFGWLATVNFRLSLTKSRDSQRRGDARALQNALDRFAAAYGHYPDSLDGTIVGCDTGQQDKFGNPLFRSCNWGNDNFVEAAVPQDPRASEGRKYVYFGNRAHWQFYASLELTTDDEYSLAVVSRNLSCGIARCNFGLSSDQTPLDKSIEEYENELRMNYE